MVRAFAAVALLLRPRSERIYRSTPLRRRLGRCINSVPMIMRLLASTAAATNSSKRSRAFGETALHAATAEQHRDAPLDAGAKALAVLERRGSFIGLAFGGFGAAPLRYAHHLDALLPSMTITFLSLKKPRSAPYNCGDVAEGLRCGVPARRPHAVRRRDFPSAPRTG